MDYRKLGDVCYIRMDRGDEMISTVLDICRREGIRSACYSGIGGCRSVEIQIFNPEEGGFRTEVLEGMLELVSFTGNVISDEAGELYHHTHAIYAFEQDGRYCTRGGHIRSSIVRYTAEVELRPVLGGTIWHMHDPETGTGYWAFKD